MYSIPVAPAACSNVTWDSRANAASVDDCFGVVAGRWSYCGTTFDGGLPQDGLPSFLPQPGGIEFAEEGGVLHFYVLMPDASGALVRTHAPAQQGTVYNPGSTAGACFFWMAPNSYPSQTRWVLERFRNPDALNVNGNTTYVAAP